MPAATTPLPSLADLEAAVRAAWSPETCDPVDLPDWSPANAARGQCGVTALVLQDLLGGELLVADVLHADGARQGVHYWNHLAGGVEVDVTREQFRDGEVVGAPEVVPRPADLSGARLLAQYELLSARVHARLGAAAR